MDDKDLAKSIAAELGPEELKAVEDILDGRGATRAWSEAMAVAGFLIACAKLAVDIWQARQDRAILVQELAEHKDLIEKHPRLDPEQRLGLMARVLMKLLPKDFGLPAPGEVAPEKQKWMADYITSLNANADSESDGDEDETRTRKAIVGLPLLLPFADQDYWIVTQPIGWLPGEGDPPGLPEVHVEAGFVTDLASVPSYLWSIFAKTGRYGNAAIYHDWLYCFQPEGCTRAEADLVFDRAMHDMGVDAATRKTMWSAVRLFGGRFWENYKLERAAGARYILKKFPTIHA